MGAFLLLVLFVTNVTQAFKNAPLSSLLPSDLPFKFAPEI